MTPQEWIARYRQYPKILQEQSVLFFAATETMTEMQERIWGRGELTDGRKLWYTENYEVWGYPPRFFNQLDQSPTSLFGPFDAPGVDRSQGKWFPTYLTYKGANNRRDLPFELTSNLRISWGGGAQFGPKQVDAFTCEIRITEYDALKVQGLNKSKGKFLDLNEKEREFHHKKVGELFQQYLAGLL